jgi:hypothetical protein
MFDMTSVGMATLRPINTVVFGLRIVPCCKLTVVKAGGNGLKRR